MSRMRDRLVALAIALVVSVVTLAASTSLGLTRDEAYYMDAGEIYTAYIDGALTGRLASPMSDAAIAPYWSYNREHPPLLKTLYGVSWRLLHRCTCAVDPSLHPAAARISTGGHTTLGVLSEITAFRVPTAVFFGVTCALVYLFFLDALGSRWGAVVAALLMAAQPRAFFHAQTASFDLPVATLWLAATAAYWRALGTTGWRRPVVVGLLFGLCLATKLQSFLLPAALCAHAAWLVARRQWPQVRAALRSFVVMAVAGPVMLFALWPWLWHDTVARFLWYVRFHLEHVHYNFEYLGTNWNQAPYPWHEPLGMLVFTAPVVLLVLAAAGAALLARPAAPGVVDDGRCTRALLLVAGVVPVGLFLLGQQPIYGETKHWLATMPFLALAAGYAFDRLQVGLSRELQAWSRSTRTALLTALVVATVLPAVVETAHSQPYGLSEYNALAGGPAGGADLGMNRQFWGYSVRALLPWFNRELPKGARLYPHDWNHDSWELYVRDGLLRPDLVDAGQVAGSDAAIVVHEKHFAEYDYQIWQEYGHVQPSEVLTLDGVPLVSVYTRTPR